MKRDMDLIRNLLFELEASGTIDIGTRGTRDRALREAHIDLLKEAGLIEFKCTRADNVTVSTYRLTWAGHDFLDQIRKDPVWDWLKSKSIEALGAVSIESVKALAPLAVQHFLAATKNPPA